MLVATSTRAVWNGTSAYPGVVELLARLRQLAPVAIVSNHAKPKWFDGLLAGAQVEFAQIQGRQGGGAMKRWAQANEVPAYRALVLGASKDDVAMAKNSGAVLVSAGWAADEAARGVGLKVESPGEVDELARLVREWSGQTYLHAEGAGYTVDALCDASSHRYVTDEQRLFGEDVAQAVKHGTPQLNQILTVTAGSLMRKGISEVDDLRWGVYPSSSMRGADEETLSDFTHRLRTTVSRVQFAKRGESLFIRHRKAPKRSAGEGGVRTDPSSEVQSLHLNPFYAKSGRLRDKNIVVVDDLTTYGVSMGVAAGFLRKAGAASVTGIAIGKLGSQLRCYDVRITGSAFRPVAAGEWSHEQVDWNCETYSSEDHSALRQILNL